MIFIATNVLHSIDSILCNFKLRNFKKSTKR